MKAVESITDGKDVVQDIISPLIELVDATDDDVWIWIGSDGFRILTEAGTEAIIKETVVGWVEPTATAEIVLDVDL